MRMNKGYFALGQIENFRAGWAVMPHSGGTKAHNWVGHELHKNYFKSKCGLIAGTNKDLGILPLNPGNFPKCKNCQRSLK